MNTQGRVYGGVGGYGGYGGKYKNSSSGYNAASGSNGTLYGGAGGGGGRPSSSYFMTTGSSGSVQSNYAGTSQTSGKSYPQDGLAGLGLVLLMW